MAMAGVLVSSLVSAILRNLNSLALQEFGIAWGLKTELENLKSTLGTIQAVLQDAEAKQWKSQAMKDWLRKLKDATYDADNLVDEFFTEALRRRMDSQRGIKPQVSAFFSLRNRLIFRLKMGNKIKDMKDRLDAIAGDRSKFHLREGVVETEVREMERGQTSSIVNESEIYGRNEEKERIIGMLLNNSSDHDNDDGVSVYAIWGMGGLGKTTLAQLVYNDGRVERHFELRIWVCVSVDFDVERLTRAILESIEGGGSNIANLDTLQRCLQEKLRGKRFLLVLDDVWNEYHEKWDGLKDAIRCGAKGCTVIVTTRIQKVALTMATLPVHHMACLSEDDSWSLFKRRAFGNKRREENLQLDLIGKEIVKKCGGLPLAIKALGSLMQFKSSENEWLSMKESEIWDLLDDGSGILPALRLSYEASPPHLRQCFAYCCIFPKDYTMRKDLLIQVWMANGFIPSRGQTTLHDMGQVIFRDLVWRSFLQDVEEYDNGEGVICKMHDLMHDLAQSVMGHECSIMKPHKGLKIPDKVRHLSFNIGSREMVPWNDVVFEVPSLRSFILNGEHNDVSPWISKQKYLRVLDLHCNNAVQKLSMSISNFSHLRYLNMSYSDIKALPESISNLQHLQTLKLTACLKLCKLPKRMKHIRNLTYLDIECCSSLTSMPAKMGQLTCLQRLSKFIVGQDEGYQIGELKELNLGGMLSILDLENVRNSEDAEKANLKSKQDLISLDLQWRWQYNEENIPKNVEEVFESLQPNPNLKKLRILFFQGSKFPNWMSGLVLKNLVEMSLVNCERCKHLPPLGKLPSLKDLKIRCMCSLKYFDRESYGDEENSFPALETLCLYEMSSLEEWTTVDRGEIFPCLRHLVVDGCPKLTKLPFLPTLGRLIIQGKGNEMLIRSAINLTSISDFFICYSELKILPDGLFQNHKALKYLKLDGCCELENLSGLENLNSLETLEINGCDNLTSLPEQGLRGLTSLRSLRIGSCKKLISLSEGMQYLTVLRNLDISHCPEMQSFPDGGLHGYKSLKWLSILHCRQLERRCKKQTGEDWLKIAHVPTIWINFEEVQSLDC